MAALVIVAMCPFQRFPWLPSGILSLTPPRRFSLFGLNFITELDGRPTPNLDAFIAVAERLADKNFVRVRLEELHSARSKVQVLFRISDVHCNRSR